MTTTDKKRYKKGYKIVCVRKDGSLGPMVGSRETVADSFHYVPGRFVVRREGWGPLAVFGNACSAHDFFDGWQFDAQLWECDYTEARCNTFMYGRTLWRPSVKMGEVFGVFVVPDGTRFAHSVRLTRLLSTHYYDRPPIEHY